MNDIVSSRKMRPLPPEPGFRDGSTGSFVDEAGPVLASAAVPGEFFFAGNEISLAAPGAGWLHRYLWLELQ